MQLTVPVREIVEATPRARIVRLDLGGRRFDYQPGQAVTVGLPGERRSPYSIATAPHESHSDGCLELLIGSEGNSREFQSALRPGLMLDVQGPVGRFTFAPSPDRQFAFIAAGTGIAPLRAMLRHAVRDSRNSVTMVYSARTPDDFAYRAELRELARSGRIGLSLSVTRPQSAHGWTEGRGRIGREQVQQIVARGAPVCFVCGPSAFVAQMRRMLIAGGLPQERVRVDEWLGPAPLAAVPARINQRQTITGRLVVRAATASAGSSIV